MIKTNKPAIKVINFIREDKWSIITLPLNNVVLLIENVSFIVITDAIKNTINDKLNINFELFFLKTPTTNKVIIESEIKTKNTTDIISKVILSGIIDPLIGGVILGALLSDTSQGGENFDHKASIKVQGNAIFLNGKPLL